MTEARPNPLVPADVDLRDFAFMPLDVLRLRDSDLATLATGDEFKAAVLLWCASWHQIPASSLPDDDRWLAKHSGAGARWKKVRTEALRGFVRCSDGRLYHEVVAEKALEAWEKKRAQRERTKAATVARDRKRRDADAQRDDSRNGLRNVERNEQRDESRNVVQGTGTGTVTSKAAALMVDPPPEARAADDEDYPEIDAARERGVMSAALRAEGITHCTPSHPTIDGWQKRGVTLLTLLEAVTLARDRKPKPQGVPLAYLEPIVEQLLEPRAPAAARTYAVNGKPWFIAGWPQIVAKGAEKGISEDAYDCAPDFRVAVLKAHGIDAEQVRKAELDYGVKA